MEEEVRNSEDGAGRRWGTRRALFDDDEAVSLILDATGRCIARRGNARISMAEVADEASVARSTLYRYFSTRTDLLREFLLARAESFISSAVAALTDPGDAAKSLPILILHPVETGQGMVITDALFAPESEGMVMSLELGTELILETCHRHFAPLLMQWQADGQIHADLDIRMTVRWIMAQSLLLFSGSWQGLSPSERRAFVDQYMVRALVRASA